MSPKPRPSNVLWTEGQQPEPVTPENPLVGLETTVLKNWLENSPELQGQYQASPENRLDLENAVRLSVESAFGKELQLRAQGLTPEQAEEETRPAMWTPPTWPKIQTSPQPSPAAKLHTTTS